MHYLCAMYEYNDKELGRIIIKPNTRAKNIIARQKGDYIQLTVPNGFGLKKLPSVLEQMRPQLKKMTPAKTQLILEDTVIKTFSFTAKLLRTNLVDVVHMRLKNEDLTVFIPVGFDLTNSLSQQIVKGMINQALRYEAKRVLSQKTAVFAKKHNLQVSDVKINKSTSRWGSCSQQKSINFSLYLMLMPEKYIDYVVLHELAHTVEMNHSEKFWKLLDGFCGEDARALGKAMKKNTPEIYLLLAK